MGFAGPIHGPLLNRPRGSCAPSSREEFRNSVERGLWGVRLTIRPPGGHPVPPCRGNGFVLGQQKISGPANRGSVHSLRGGGVCRRSSRLVPGFSETMELGNWTEVSLTPPGARSSLGTMTVPQRASIGSLKRCSVAGGWLRARLGFIPDRLRDDHPQPRTDNQAEGAHGVAVPPVGVRFTNALVSLLIRNVAGAMMSPRVFELPREPKISQPRIAPQIMYGFNIQRIRLTGVTGSALPSFVVVVRCECRSGCWRFGQESVALARVQSRCRCSGGSVVPPYGSLRSAARIA